MRSLRHFIHAPIRRNDELPPELQSVLPVTAGEHDAFIERTRSELEHRERVLRALEARARVIGGNHDLGHT
jgi:hypothetical protein